jgi:transposase
MADAAESAKLAGKPKYIVVNRAQSYWGAIDLDDLIDAEHPARAIWLLTGRLDVSGFEESIRSREGRAGAPSHSPRLLVSVWLYAYSLGIGSARAVERMMKHEPGLRWLCADQPVSHHTLSDFRTSGKEKLNQLFASVLATMDEEGLIDLRTLMQDGTKMRAVASKSSFHRQATLRSKCEQARALVEVLEHQTEQDGGEAEDKRRAAARGRAARERVQRMEASLEELTKRQEEMPTGKRDEVRVSESEPECRKMLQTEGGFAPSYNVQITTETASKLVVSIEVVNAANDTQELIPALDRVKEQYGCQPEQIVADGGYATRDNVEATTERNVELVAPWKEDASREAGARATNQLDPQFAPSQFQILDEGQQLRCPAGQTLVSIRTHKHHGQRYVVYEASSEDCGRCEHQPRCLKPEQQARRVERVCESDTMKAWLARQQQTEWQQRYKRRKAVAEFPQLRFKGNWGLRRFLVRGLVKVNCEAIWIAMAFNVSQWFRLKWMPRVAAAA